MHERFVANFNKTTNRIPTSDIPTIGNLKTFFISALPPNINYDLRRSRPINLADTQRKVVELEDDMISTRKWK